MKIEVETYGSALDKNNNITEAFIDGKWDLRYNFISSDNNRYSIVLSKEESLEIIAKIKKSINAIEKIEKLQRG